MESGKAMMLRNLRGQSARPVARRTCLCRAYSSQRIKTYTYPWGGRLSREFVVDQRRDRLAEVETIGATASAIDSTNIQEFPCRYEDVALVVISKGTASERGVHLSLWGPPSVCCALNLAVCF